MTAYISGCATPDRQYSRTTLRQFTESAHLISYEPMSGQRHARADHLQLQSQNEVQNTRLINNDPVLTSQPDHFRDHNLNPERHRWSALRQCLPQLLRCLHDVIDRYEGVTEQQPTAFGRLDAVEG